MFSPRGERRSKDDRCAMFGEISESVKEFMTIYNLHLPSAPHYIDAQISLYSFIATLSQERKYFDSGDYAMHKAGVSSDLGGRPLAVGTAIPTPEG